MDAVQMAQAAGGGVLIGAGAVGYLVTHGRIAGVTGLMVSSTECRVEDRGGRIGFLAGLVGAGVLAAVFAPSALSNSTPSSLGLVVLAGLIVGIGSRWGNGCTSGHAFCGVGRLSPRSIVATTMFAVVGAVSLLLGRAVSGGVL